VADFYGIDIPLKDTPSVAALCSGGADSAVLLYALRKLMPVDQTLHVFSFAKDMNFRTGAVSTARVIERIIQLTGNNRFTHHTKYVETYNARDLVVWCNEFRENMGLIWLYTGITANPPKEIADSFFGESRNTEHDIRDPMIKHDVELWRQDISAGIIRPFVNSNKKDIARLYSDAGLLETLFPVSLSCEQPEALENFNHCGDCWWCAERYWGFGRYV
jgi:7-cyano-7-deazaguanine synthase in queuosine biosynthesis